MVTGVAVYRMHENTFQGRQLYVDDLVTDEKRRSTGVGQALLAHLEQKARAASLENLALDSGTQRQQAHKFYFREGMVVTSFHFGKKTRMKPINVGLLGIGTVGGGTWNVLARNREEISRRAGRDIRISVVADKEVDKAKKLVGGAARVVADAFAVVRDPEIDIVIELIGGYTVAKDLVLAAIEHGKHVVTANKALLATHGNEIFAAAQKKGVMVAFEGAVAGGIPIIKALREGLTANRIEWIAGIINGTSNFILSEMRDKGPRLRRGAEGGAAPRLRRGRPDLRHRGRGRRRTSSPSCRRSPSASRCSSTSATRRASRSSPQADIRYAEQLGYRIKLLGITKHVEGGHRAARASDADPGEKADRQRRGRDERGAGEGRRGRADDVLRRGRRAPSRPAARWSPTWSTSRGCTPPTPSTACRTSRSSPTACRASRSCRWTRS